MCKTGKYLKETADYSAEDAKFMELAINLSIENIDNGGGPFGAVIVKDGQIVARGHNLRENTKDATMHAEIVAIRQACEKIGDWRLEGCDIYVTLEPCPMCMGASLNARVDKIFFGAYEQKGRSLTAELADANLLNHKTEVVGGVLQDECSALLSSFFIAMRKKQKEEKERAKAAEQQNENLEEKEV